MTTDRHTLDRTDLRGIDLLCERGESVEGIWTDSEGLQFLVWFELRIGAEQYRAQARAHYGGRSFYADPGAITVDSDTYARIQAAEDEFRRNRSCEPQGMARRRDGQFVRQAPLGRLGGR